MPKWSAREWSKYPYFQEFSTLELNISRTKIFRARPTKAFFIPMTRKIGYTHFWGDLTAVQKNTPLGGRPPPNFFFNPQTSLRGPPWFRKTSLQRDLNFRMFFELLTHSAPAATWILNCIYRTLPCYTMFMLVTTFLCIVQVTWDRNVAFNWSSGLI